VDPNAAMTGAGEGWRRSMALKMVQMSKTLAVLVGLVATPVQADLARDVTGLFNDGRRAVEAGLEDCILTIRFAFVADDFSNVLIERYALRDLDFGAADIEAYDDGVSAALHVPLRADRAVAYETARKAFSDAKSDAVYQARQSNEPPDWDEAAFAVNEAFLDGALAGEYGPIPAGSLSVFREERDGRISMGVAVNTGIVITTRSGDPVTVMDALAAYASATCPPT